MGIGQLFYVRNLLAQDLRGRIADVQRQGGKLVIPRAAAQLAREYPGFSEQDLRNRLFAEAVQAGVPMDLRKRRRRH